MLFCTMIAALLLLSGHGVASFLPLLIVPFTGRGRRRAGRFNVLGQALWFDEEFVTCLDQIQAATIFPCYGDGCDVVLCRSSCPGSETLTSVFTFPNSVNATAFIRSLNLSCRPILTLSGFPARWAIVLIASGILLLAGMPILTDRLPIWACALVGLSSLVGMAGVTTYGCPRVRVSVGIDGLYLEHWIGGIATQSLFIPVQALTSVEGEDRHGRRHTHPRGRDAIVLEFANRRALRINSLPSSSS